MRLGILRALKKLGALTVTTGWSQDGKCAVRSEQTIETNGGSGRLHVTHEMVGEDHGEALQLMLAQVQHIAEIQTKLRVVVGNGR